MLLIVPSRVELSQMVHILYRLLHFSILTLVLVVIHRLNVFFFLELHLLHACNHSTRHLTYCIDFFVMFSVSAMYRPSLL